VKTCCGDVPLYVAEGQRRVLQIVLWINVAMFLAEFVAGIVAHSTSLLADSVDMLGVPLNSPIRVEIFGSRPSAGEVAGEPVLLIGHRFQNPCDGMRNARLKREDAFSHAMIIVSSAMVSSS